MFQVSLVHLVKRVNQDFKDVMVHLEEMVPLVFRESQVSQVFLVKWVLQV